MSWQATAWVIEKSKHKGSALLTLLCIANCANESGANAFPGMPRLARDTRMSLRQVSRIIEKLEASGELAVERREGRNHHYSLPLMAPDKLTGVQKPKTPDISAPTPDILTATPDIAVSSDPSVRSVSKNDQRSRARGYKQEPKPPEPKFLYPPPDFEITNSLYVWLAENCFSFTDAELSEATAAWRESRESKPNHFARTLPMWQADWQKFIRVYWNIRQQRNGNGHKKSEQEYTGPVKSKPNPIAENCPDCRGMGNIRFEIDGIWYAKPCKHERSGVAAA